jgi:hypothetical protein
MAEYLKELHVHNPDYVTNILYGDHYDLHNQRI